MCPINERVLARLLLAGVVEPCAQPAGESFRGGEQVQDCGPPAAVWAGEPVSLAAEMACGKKQLHAVVMSGRCATSASLVGVADFVGVAVRKLALDPVAVVASAVQLGTQ